MPRQSKTCPFLVWSAIIACLPGLVLISPWKGQEHNKIFKILLCTEYAVGRTKQASHLTARDARSDLHRSALIRARSRNQRAKTGRALMADHSSSRQARYGLHTT